MTYEKTIWPNPRAIFFVLVLVSLIAPHTLGIRRHDLPDNSYARYTLTAALWTIIHETGSTIAGPYSQTLFPFPNEPALLWIVLFIPLQLCTSCVILRYVKGITGKGTALRVVVAALVIQALLAGGLWFGFDSWLFVSVYPLPIFHLVSLSIMFRKVR